MNGRGTRDILGPLITALKDAKSAQAATPTRLGRCGGVDASGAVLITFDGETAPSGRSYPRLASYGSPNAGERVLLVRAGATWVAVGPLVGTAAIVALPPAVEEVVAP